MVLWYGKDPHFAIRRHNVLCLQLVRREVPLKVLHQAGELRAMVCRKDLPPG
jgi:hypothetical protein